MPSNGEARVVVGAMHLVEGVDKRRGAVRHVFVPRRAHHFIQALADGVLQPAVDEVLLRRTLEYNMSMLYKYDHFLHPNPCRWRPCVCVCVSSTADEVLRRSRRA